MTRYNSEIYTIHRVVQNVQGRPLDSVFDEKQIKFISSLPHVAIDGEYLVICGVPVPISYRACEYRVVIYALWRYLEYKHKVLPWKVWPDLSEYDIEEANAKKYT